MSGCPGDIASGKVRYGVYRRSKPVEECGYGFVISILLLLTTVLEISEERQDLCKNNADENAVLEQKYYFTGTKTQHKQYNLIEAYSQ